MDVLLPEGWKKGKGYSHGMAETIEPGDKLITLGGLIGWNGQEEFESDDFIEQCRQTLENVVTVLAQAGAEPSDVMSMTWYITDKEECLARQKELGAAYRATMGDHFPAMAMVEVKALMEDRAKVEIETRAVVKNER
ncbi:RidA family protein [Hwanghaeella grinnelliae]|nr:RidA family protein [Hwanghaeella grinnelliae]